RQPRALQQPPDTPPPLQPGGGRPRPPPRSGRGRPPQRTAPRAPNPPRVALLRLHHPPPGAPGQPRRADPGPQQNRLPAPGRRRDHRHPPRTPQPLEKPAPADEPRTRLPGASPVGDVTSGLIDNQMIQDTTHQ